MTNIQKLVDCFSYSFPDLPYDQILLVGEKTSTEWDSLKVLELILNMETTFGISIPTDHIERLKSVSDFIQFIPK